MDSELTVFRPLLVALVLAAGCSPDASTPPPPGGPVARAVRLVGTVHGATSGARVAVLGKSATVRADGGYQIDGLDEGGAVVVASAAGQHDDVAVTTLVPPETRLDLMLSPSAGSLDLAFTGNVAFTSRTRALPDDKAALVAAVAPLTRSADVAVVAFESVLAEPGAPHPARPQLLASPPTSAAALTALGADVVVLATDHIYDYLDEGVGDTLDNVKAAGMTPLGAGRNEAEARAATVISRNGVSVGFIALSMLTGRGEEQLVAEPPFFDAGRAKGGAARLDSVKLDAAVAELRGRADRVVVLLHGGRERAEEPAPDLATAAHRAIDAGADLVVAAHPRVPQAVERYRDKLIFYSLGDFAFDDDEPTAWQGAVLRVRLPKSGPPQSVRLDPVYVEGLAPAAATGSLRRSILDTFAERSAALGVSVLSDGRVLAVAPTELTGSDSSSERAEPVISGEGATFALGDLLGPERHLTRVALVAPADASLWLGRDLLATGGLEDELADGVHGAPTGFEFPSDSEQVAAGQTPYGRLSLSICRSGTARDTASARSRGRYPAGPNLTVSLCGCWRGDPGTTAAVRVLFYDSLAEDAGAIESKAVVSGAPPTDWECFCHPAGAPKGARFVELRLDHTPSADHTACVGFDDLHLVSWTAQSQSTLSLAPMNGTTFLRVTGAGSASQARLGVTVRTVTAP